MRKVSVIVPVYKTEEYLNKCVESIVSQSYSDLEIILVNDGSPDGCPKMCDAWMEKDNRIKVIHKENGGMSDARNTGLKNVTGDMIAFVDSDDYFESDFIEIMVNKMQETESDIVMCGFYRVDSKNNRIGDGYFVPDKVVNKSEIPSLFNELFEPSPLGYVWNKLYKADLFDGLFFEQGRYIEDMLINVNLLLRAKRVCSIDQQLYAYRDNPNAVSSVNNREKTIKMYQDFCYSINVRLDVLKQHMDDQEFSEYVDKNLRYFAFVVVFLPPEEQQLAWQCFDRNFDLYKKYIKGWRSILLLYSSRYAKSIMMEWKKKRCRL